MANYTIDAEKNLTEIQHKTAMYLNDTAFQLNALASKIMAAEAHNTGFVSVSKASKYLGGLARKKVLELCKDGLVNSRYSDTGKILRIDFESLQSYKRNVCSADFIADKFFINQNKIQENA